MRPAITFFNIQLSNSRESQDHDAGGHPGGGGDPGEKKCWKKSWQEMTMMVI